MNTYIITEPSNGELFFGNVPRPYVLGELVPTARPELEGVAPVLMRLEQAERQLSFVEESAETAYAIGRPPLVCAILRSDVRADHLKRHLSEKLLIARPGQESTVFRFYDPRVFGQLSWILDSEQFASLLGPVSHWRWLDEMGNWKAVDSGCSSNLDMELSAAQLGQLRRLNVTRKAIGLLRSSEAKISDDVALKIDKMIRKAEVYNLPDDDQLSFALHGVLVASNFDQHPKVRAVLSSVHKIPYTQAVISWTDEVWERIAKECVEYAYL